MPDDPQEVPLPIAPVSEDPVLIEVREVRKKINTLLKRTRLRQPEPAPEPEIVPQPEPAPEPVPLPEPIDNQPRHDIVGDVLDYLNR